MAQTDEIKPRATLPGTIYKKNGRWWWRVRLPGQDRIRCRSLRPEGSRVGTRSREQAGQIALGLWEEALMAKAKQDLVENPPLERKDGASSRAGKATVPSQQVSPGESLPCANVSDNGQSKDDLPGHGPDSSRSLHAVESVTPSQLQGHLDWLSPLDGVDDHALCECCGLQDFFEEYLRRIDSGQRLCPRCYGEFKKKAKARDQLLSV